MHRLFIKITRDNLPQVKDRYPFLYLERGRLEVDDSSVKWVDSDGGIVRIPCATINALFLGPGTSITHEAVKVLSASNCCVCWVGEDSMNFYAVGQNPTADTRNMRDQISLATNPEKSVEVARRMFHKRFKDIDLSGKNIKEMMALEGLRVRELYKSFSVKYGVKWSGRSFQPGQLGSSDITNQYLTIANSALYGIVSAAVHSLGYSPHVGFIHSGSPLPFVYDVADFYKERVCIDLAFSLSSDGYVKEKMSEEFRKRVIDNRILETIADDIKQVLYGVQ